MPRRKKASRRKPPAGRAKKAARRKSSGRKTPKKKARKRAARRPVRRLSAKDMARTQREISVAEFFAKNRHLLGYDNPSKALLTVVREAVDNALDACEEAGILPDLVIEIQQIKTRTKTEEPKTKSKRTLRSGSTDRYRVVVEDNGPGIVSAQISKIFGKLLYGSKFHRLCMSRGQQGIGISAAALYGQLTTGKPMRITSRTSKRKPADVLTVTINTSTNKPRTVSHTKDPKFKPAHGTRVELQLEGRYTGGPRSVHEYLRQTALANPHARIRFTGPGDEEPHEFVRAVRDLPEPPREIQPHPYGVELGMLIKMLGESKERRVSTFLQRGFSRVSARAAKEILAEAGIAATAKPAAVARHEAESLHGAMNRVRLMAPPTDCLAPIGPEALERGLKKEVEADFYTSVTRAPNVYRGNPFQVECALAYGGPLPAEQSAKLYRFANRVPLLYQQGACAITKAVTSISWRSYDLQQPRGALPIGPLVVLVHVASVWVPFTSESKEAVAAYEEIRKEIRLALQECGRRLGLFVRKRKRLAAAAKKTDYITQYLPAVVEALRDLLDLSEGQTKKTSTVLREVLRKSRAL